MAHRTSACPKCGGIKLRRSRRRGVLERALQAAGWRWYRCSTCQHRASYRGEISGLASEHAGLSKMVPAQDVLLFLGASVLGGLAFLYLV